LRYRESCLGCPLMATEDAVTDPRVSPLVDSHAHDGRFGLPGGNMLFSARSAPRLRCAVDGRRARQRRRCRFRVDDARLAEALARLADAGGTVPGATMDSGRSRP